MLVVMVLGNDVVSGHSVLARWPGDGGGASLSFGGVPLGIVIWIWILQALFSYA